jgi:hypothetical protein
MIAHAVEYEDEIAAEERALDENLDEIEQQAKAPVDWRALVRRHPLAFLGVAIGGGVFLATVVGQRWAPDAGGPTLEDGDSEDAPDENDTESGDPELDDADSSAAHEIWEDLTVALLGAGTAKATEFMAGLLPGLHEEFELQRQKRGKPRPKSRARAEKRGL